MRSRNQWGISMLVLFVVVAAMDLSISKAKEKKKSKPKSQVVLGEYAPDFNVPCLLITKSKKGTPIGVINPKRTFHLASLRGKRPVCLIMSSYT